MSNFQRKIVQFQVISNDTYTEVFALDENGKLWCKQTSGTGTTWMKIDGPEYGA